MKIISLFISIVLTVFTLALTSCTSIPNPQKTPTGFLPNYEALQLTNQTYEGIQTYRYINPNFKISDYHGVMIDPVILYQHINESSNGKVTKEVLAQTQQVLDSNLKDMVSKKFNVVEKSAPGIARLQVAITGAVIKGDGVKIWNIIPISAVIRLATIAAGYDNKRAVLIVEAKITDSHSGKLLGDAASVISSEKFRQEVKTVDEFKSVVQIWIKTTIQHAYQYKVATPVLKTN